MSLLGIQVGARGCRAVAVTPEGRLVAQGARSYHLAESAGRCELDGATVWASIRDLLAETAAATRQDPVTALSVAAMGEALTPISVEGQMLDSCILGDDGRGAHYVGDIVAQVGRERLFAITGSVPGISYTLPRLCWLRDHAPELYWRTWRFAPWSAMVTHLLGGRPICDPTLASRTLLFDLHTGNWSRELLAAAGLPLYKLPEVATAGKEAGTIAPHLARELGFPPGVQLRVGAHELCCNALGAGVAAPQAAALSLSASLHMMPAFQAVPLQAMMLQQGLSIAPHVAPELFVTLIYHRSGGRLLRWFRDTLAPLETREAQKRGTPIYHLLLGEMPTEPSPVMALPHLDAAGPPRFEPGGMGAFVGLSLDTTRGEMLKALLEAGLFHFAEGLAALQSIGTTVACLRATGEGAGSDAWLQLAADILGLPVERTTHSRPAALGAAMVAGVGSKVYETYGQAVEAQVRVTARFEPNPARRARYVEKLARYQELRARLAASAPEDMGRNETGPETGAASPGESD